MIFKGQCPSCTVSAKVDVPDGFLRGIDRKAAAANLLSSRGWTYRSGRMGKSVFTIFCPNHRPDRLILESDNDR